MLFGLLISPISWTHHWVWMLPLAMWLVLGPFASGRPGPRLGVGGAGLPRLAVVGDFAGDTAGRPALVRRLVGSLYVLAALATLAYLAAGQSDDPVDVARHRDVLVGDAALGMRDEHESDRPPTDVDVGMVVLALRRARRRGARRRCRRGMRGTPPTGAGLRRSAPSPRGPASAASTCSSVNTAMLRRYTVASVPNQIVVAGALIVGATLLVAQRDRPPELAGLWELPGGKVAPGESDAAALARELDEELGVEVGVGARLGADVALASR